MGGIAMAVYDPGPAFTPGSWPYDSVNYGRRHTGLDFEAPQGTPIPAAAAGVVVGRGNEPTYGNIVIVRHTGAAEPPYRYTLYAHMNADIPVALEAVVSRGQTLGTVDRTGSGSNNVDHLHFELLALESTWEDEWEGGYKRSVWRDGMALMITGTTGRVDPGDEANWVGLDVYAPPPPPTKPSSSERPGFGPR
jgi:murein DD-endopeptidase MepM/ murein hydrolase activator NlpD